MYLCRNEALPGIWRPAAGRIDGATTGTRVVPLEIGNNGASAQNVQITGITDITVLSGSGAVYTVTISGFLGSGTLGLNLIDDGSIHDLAGRQLTVSAFTGLVFTKSSSSAAKKRA